MRVAFILFLLGILGCKNENSKSFEINYYLSFGECSKIKIHQDSANFTIYVNNRITKDTSIILHQTKALFAHSLAVKLNKVITRTREFKNEGFNYLDGNSIHISNFELKSSLMLGSKQQKVINAIIEIERIMKQIFHKDSIVLDYLNEVHFEDSSLITGALNAKRKIHYK